jgi:hypothetical protein
MPMRTRHCNRETLLLFILRLRKRRCDETTVGATDGKVWE